VKKQPPELTEAEWRAILEELEHKPWEQQIFFNERKSILKKLRAYFDPRT
jgi:hypothetical protein